MSQAFRSLVAPDQDHPGAHFGGVYLDYNATTPVDPRVADVVTELLGSRFGNAASPHRRGRAAAAAIERAAEQVSQLVGCGPSEIVWTSGSTEGINTVIKGLSLNPTEPRRKIVASAAEHKAVLDSLSWTAEALGIRVVFARPNEGGGADPASLSGHIDEDTFLVVAMAANNETGALSDIDAIGELAHAYGAQYLCDITQLPGKAHFNLSKSNVDYAVLSAHKMYGPQGVGALVANQEARRRLVPLIHGGGHQAGLRSGTLNLPGIVGFGEAAEIAQRELSHGEHVRVGRMREALEEALEATIDDVTIHGREAHRLPNTSSVRFAGVDGEALVASMGDIAIATGSACTSSVPAPSHVLTSMGLSDEAATETVRISIGRFTSEQDLERATDRIAMEVARIRSLVG